MLDGKPTGSLASIESTVTHHLDSDALTARFKFKFGLLHSDSDMNNVPAQTPGLSWPTQSTITQTESESVVQPNIGRHWNRCDIDCHRSGCMACGPGLGPGFLVRSTESFTVHGSAAPLYRISGYTNGCRGQSYSRCSECLSWPGQATSGITTNCGPSYADSDITMVDAQADFKHTLALQDYNNSINGSLDWNAPQDWVPQQEFSNLCASRAPLDDHISQELSVHYTVLNQESHHQHHTVNDHIMGEDYSRQESLRSPSTYIGPPQYSEHGTLVSGDTLQLPPKEFLNNRLICKHQVTRSRPLPPVRTSINHPLTQSSGYSPSSFAIDVLKFSVPKGAASHDATQKSYYHPNEIVYIDRAIELLKVTMVTDNFYLLEVSGRSHAYERIIRVTKGAPKDKLPSHSRQRILQPSCLRVDSAKHYRWNTLQAGLRYILEYFGPASKHELKAQFEMALSIGIPYWMSDKNRYWHSLVWVFVLRLWFGEPESLGHLHSAAFGENGAMKIEPIAVAIFSLKRSMSTWLNKNFKATQTTEKESDRYSTIKAFLSRDDIRRATLPYRIELLTIGQGVYHRLGHLVDFVKTITSSAVRVSDV
ncbi:hypothetical protein SERLA73DRAFT_78493 [Serpula lacrymans var. lacrymans S7.3]|uniref:Uncharacterized protein n=1 Tax=Serpula lacrymans var. lacrymans (strain S7.3) TaxID=936435 RepID=F8QDE5_SERL3|nr:hypothetical protein SERLA73DRAFT_78493 [Serpula lacrymans var. lacrymans S7.3]